MANNALMKDATTLSYINLYAILGAIPRLVELDDEAASLIRGKNISIAFVVKDGAKAALRFKDGKCVFTENTDGCDIVIPFKTPEKFNGMIDGTVTPIPSKGLTKVKFLLGEFTQLTNILSKYLKATEDDLKDDSFFEKSTKLMLRVIGGAAAQIGNHDRIGKCSAGYIVDGIIKLAIKDCDAVYIKAENHCLTALGATSEKPMSSMEFGNIRLARDLFDGKVNAVVCVGQGQIRINGMISQIDNLNRMLDRVAVYLA